VSQDVHPFSHWLPQAPFVPSNCIARDWHHIVADWPDIE
jgi:hypothetical protein